jgi:hypothetical protein
MNVPRTDSSAESMRPALAWAALALAGQGASLALIHAGKGVAYQHYVPWSALGAHPLALAVLLAECVAVAWGLWMHRAAITRGVRRVLPGWRLPLWLLAMVATSAIVGRDLPRLVGELVLSTGVQLLSLGAVTCAALALPASARAWWKQRTDILLGTETGHGPDMTPRLDAFAWRLAAAVTVVCALLAVLAYERLPHIPDEIAYLVQARMLAQGVIALPNPPVPAAFELYLLASGSTGWYSPVPPGLALVFVPGVWLGVPWLVNPVLTGLNILLAYLLLQPLGGRRFARLGVLLLAVSPWHLFLGMSFMPHAATLACGLLAALSVARVRRTGAWQWTWLGGAALALVAAIRQLDAAILAVGIGLWSIGLGGRRLRISGTAGLVLGSMLATVPLLLYNRHFTGKPGEFPIMSYTDALYGKGANAYGFGPDRGMGWALDPNPGHGPLDATINTALNLTATQVELFGWATGSLLLLYAFVLRGRFTQSDRAMFGLIVLTWLAYFFNYFSGGPDFGARYWFLMIVPLVALTARAALWVGQDDGSSRDRMTNADAPGRMLFALTVLSAGGMLLFVPWRAADKYWHYRGMSSRVLELGTTAGIGRGERNDLVIIAGREVPDYASAVPFNPLDLSAPVPVYVRRTTPQGDSAIIKAFPTRRVWFVDGPTRTGNGYVVRAGPLGTAAALDTLDSWPR